MRLEANEGMNETFNERYNSLKVLKVARDSFKNQNADLTTRFIWLLCMHNSFSVPRFDKEALKCEESKNCAQSNK